MTLDEWLKQHKADCSEAAFAKRIGKTQQSVNRYRKGEQNPDLKTLEAIFRETGGDVHPNSFFSSEPAKAPSTEAAA